MQDILNKQQKFTFCIKLEGKTVAKIHYTRSLIAESAQLEILDKDKLPGLIQFCLLHNVDMSNALIIFLRERVVPSNRMFLAESCEKYGIDPEDWLTRIQYNEGKSHEDSYSVLVEKID